MQITLLIQSTPDNLNQVQTELLNYLLPLRGQTIGMRQIITAMGCRTEQPILSRLEHLAEKGLIAIQ